jgi:phosphoribosylformylglycinamidine synthase
VTLDCDLPPNLLLFHEGPSRILVSTADMERVLRVARENGVHAIEIGATLKARVTISNRNEVLIDDRVDELKGLWSGALEHLLHNSVAV